MLMRASFLGILVALLGCGSTESEHSSVTSQNGTDSTRLATDESTGYEDVDRLEEPGLTIAVRALEARGLLTPFVRESCDAKYLGLTESITLVQYLNGIGSALRLKPSKYAKKIDTDDSFKEAWPLLLPAISLGFSFVRESDSTTDSAPDQKRYKPSRLVSLMGRDDLFILTANGLGLIKLTNDSSKPSEEEEKEWFGDFVDAVTKIYPNEDPKFHLSMEEHAKKIEENRMYLLPSSGSVAAKVSDSANTMTSVFPIHRSHANKIYADLSNTVTRQDLFLLLYAILAHNPTDFGFPPAQWVQLRPMDPAVRSRYFAP